ncbi:MAG: pilin [Candidatus Paceibacterota bacterium]
MKKIFGIMVAGMVFFGIVFTASALSPCSEIVNNQPEVLANWNSLPLEAQQSYYSAYCGGSAATQGCTPSGDGVTCSTLSADTKIQNPIKYSNFSDFAAAIIKAAVQVMMPFIVLAFIYSGFLFVKAQGNETELTEAKKAIQWSVIGAFVLLGAWGFAQIIGQTVSTLTQ